MAISAEQLNIILSAKDKEFTRAMDRSQKRVERFASQSNKSLGKTSKAFSKLGSAVKIAAAAFSGSAIISGIKDVTEKLDSIGKTADQIGITTDALQELRTVAESSGVTSDELDKSIEKLGKGLAEAAMGLGTAKDGLKTLGLNARDLIDMGLEDALGVIATEINKLPNPMEKTAAATQLFGRSGAPMINLLREGADGMANMRREARELGVVIDEDLIRNAEAAQDQLDLMSRVIDANLSSALINLAPLIVGTTEKIAGLASRVGNLISNINEIREQGVGKTVVTSAYVTALEKEARAAGYVQEELVDLLRARSKLNKAPAAADGSFGPDQDLIDDVHAAVRALDAALEGGPNRTFNENAESVRELETAAQNALSIAMRQTEEVREQARLRGISAEAAERERIEAEKQALIASITAPYAKDGTLEDRPMFIQEAEKVGEAYEAAAIAASRILNPVKAVAVVTGNIKTEAELAREAYENMLNKMIEASPALQQLGFDSQILEDTMLLVQDSMENAFMSMIDGTMSAKDAFKSMASEIIKELYRVLVVQQMVGSFKSDGGGILGSIFGAMSGSSSSSGGGKASGGAVQAGRPYMTGEHGRELFVPSTAGRVLSVAQSKAAVGGGDSVVVNQTINVTTGIQQTVRAEIVGLMPQIQEASKAAVLDAKRRGGSFAGAF